MSTGTARSPSIDFQKQIIRAAKNGDVVTVKKLLKQDMSLLNARDKDGSTPLHCAAWKGHDELVKLLLDSGADVDARNENGDYGTTALHAAAHGNQTKVAKILIEGGADLRAKNLSGRTPLQETTVHNARAVARLLEASGAR